MDNLIQEIKDYQRIECCSDMILIVVLVVLLLMCFRAYSFIYSFLPHKMCANSGGGHQPSSTSEIKHQNDHKESRGV